jgi:uncharacterized protein (DUF2147 family)
VQKLLVAASMLALATAWNEGARSAESPSAFTGIWMTDDGDGAVELRGCGDELCGYIYAILHRPNPSLPAIDRRNTNPGLQSRPLCGLQVIGGLHKISPTKWGDGWIYDPKVGKTYGVDVSVEEQTLVVHGYLPGTFLGRSVSWTPAHDPPKQCVAPPSR